MNTAEPKHEHRQWLDLFPLVVGAVVVAAVATLRVATGVGFGGMRSDAAFTTLGIFLNEHDNLQYLSWCRQGAEGRWLFDDRFTLEPHAAVVFHPTFLAVGRLSRATGLDLQQVMIAAGLAAIPVLLMAVWALAKMIGLSAAGARYAVLIAAAGSGLTNLNLAAYGLLMGGRAGPPPGWLYGADRDYLDAIFLPTFIEYPFITICYAILAMQCLVLARADALLDSARPARLVLVALATLTALLGLSHPYEHVFVATSFTSAVAIDFVRSGPSRLSALRRLPAVVAVAAPSAAVFGYYMWMSGLEGWSDVARQSLDLPASRTTWVWGYGVLLPLAVVGGVVLKQRHMDDRGPSRGSWLVIWAAFFLVPLVLFEVSRSKICAGGYLPLTLLGAVAFETWDRSIKSIEKGRPQHRAWASRGAWIILWLLLLQGSASHFSFMARQSVRVRSEVIALSSRLSELESTRVGGMSRTNALAGQSLSMPGTLLAPPPLCRMLVPRTGIRVYCGNIYKTINYHMKEERLYAAGILPPSMRIFDLRIIAKELDRLLTENDFDYVVTVGHVPADDILPDTSRFQGPEHFGCFNLYVARRR